MSHYLRIRDDAIWSFETARFFVGCYAEPEDTDPADAFQFPEDVEFARRDDPAAWFVASVRVFLIGADDTWQSDWTEVGRDVLGGCSYVSFSDFLEAHRDPADRGGSYFSDMVHAAIADARRTLRRLPRLRAA